MRNVLSSFSTALGLAAAVVAPNPRPAGVGRLSPGRRGPLPGSCWP
jgi:hypothetical protein